MSKFWAVAMMPVAAAFGPAAPTLSISKPFTLASHDLISQMSYDVIDAAMYAVRKADGTLNFWAGGCTPWGAMSSNGGEMKASNLLFKEVPVNGYKCPEGYPSNCLRLAGQKKSRCNVGMWPANVYNIGGDEILAFIHLEFRCKSWNIRHGLAYSNDGGKNFQWLDYIVGPAGPCGKSLSSGCKTSNMGLSNYIIKNGFFQLYYQDNIKMNQKATGPHQPGTAVARASVADVVAAARKGKASPWFKYYNGAWTEAGVGGNFTALNLPAEGYLHGDAIYIKDINQYAIVAQSGDRSSSTWHKSILLAFSSDGMTWSEWQEVYTDGHAGDVSYPSLMSYGPDNEVAGKTFGVVYQYKGSGGNLEGAPRPPPFNMVNVTVSAGSVVV